MPVPRPELDRDVPAPRGGPASRLRRRWGRSAGEDRAPSRFDGLSGLGSQRGLEEELQRFVELAIRSGQDFSLLVLAVDDPTTFDDAAGHAVGDRIPGVIASAMRDVGRPIDRLFRSGADEFAMIMQGADIERAAYVARRLQHLCSRPLDGGAPIFFSAGISVVPQFGTDALAVARQADIALQWARRNGPGVAQIYDPARDQSVDRGAGNVVREIIAGRALAPVYQPIVDPHSGRVLGFEGLVRPDPRGPLSDVTQLFEAAASSGHTIELDVACFEAVISGARGLEPDQVLTLNVSPSTLEVPDFDAGWLLGRLMRAGIAPSRVILEMTEREEVHDVRRLQTSFDHLRQYGVRIAADDVGANNAGLRLLSQMRFDIVKIDLSLVQLGNASEGSLSVLTSLTDLATSQESVVVAEGVETTEQLRTIRDLHIQAAQGFLLGRPIASTAVSHIDLGTLIAPPAQRPYVAAYAPAPYAPAAPAQPYAVSAAVARQAPAVPTAVEGPPAAHASPDPGDEPPMEGPPAALETTADPGEAPPMEGAPVAVETTADARLPASPTDAGPPPDPEVLQRLLDLDDAIRPSATPRTDEVAVSVAAVAVDGGPA